MRISASWALSGVSSTIVWMTKSWSFLSSLWSRTFHGGRWRGGFFFGACLRAFFGLTAAALLPPAGSFSSVVAFFSVSFSAITDLLETADVGCTYAGDYIHTATIRPRANFTPTRKASGGYGACVRDVRASECARVAR